MMREDAPIFRLIEWVRNRQQRKQQQSARSRPTRSTQANRTQSRVRTQTGQVQKATELQVAQPGLLTDPNSATRELIVATAPGHIVELTYLGLFRQRREQLAFIDRRQSKLLRSINELERNIARVLRVAHLQDGLAQAQPISDGPSPASPAPSTPRNGSGGVAAIGPARPATNLSNNGQH
jgi:hypothetical protein